MLVNVTNHTDRRTQVSPSCVRTWSELAGSHVEYIVQQTQWQSWYWLEGTRRSMQREETGQHARQGHHNALHCASWDKPEGEYMLVLPTSHSIRTRAAINYVHPGHDDDGDELYELERNMCRENVACWPTNWWSNHPNKRIIREPAIIAIQVDVELWMTIIHHCSTTTTRAAIMKISVRFGCSIASKHWVQARCVVPVEWNGTLLGQSMSSESEWWRNQEAKKETTKVPIN